MVGALAVDDRGEVGFVNDFTFDGVKRFYTVANHASGFVRAWHGHRREGKYVTAMAGAFVIGAVQIDDWDAPSKDLPVSRWVLSDRKPSVLWIPPGYVNGFMSLDNYGRLAFFSTATLEDSLDDDIRFPARMWDAWSVEER